MQNNNFMQLALKQAQLAFEHNEVPVGAVITENNQVISHCSGYYS
jgi:tRNA(Arg) A34 adenosine deaminase TadA